MQLFKSHSIGIYWNIKDGKYKFHAKSKAFVMQKDSDAQLKHLCCRVIATLSFSSGC